jgi:uncharacterized membrane protein YjjB (DUF3815 family)
VTDALVAGLEHGLWAGIAAVCFGVLLNVPPRTVLACGVTGLLAYDARSLLLAVGIATALPANLFASIAVSLLSIAWGRILCAPAIVFVIPGVIPLIPGALAFRTIVGLMAVLDVAGDAQQRALTEAAANGLRTISIVAALAIGVAVPSMLLRPRRPML